MPMVMHTRNPRPVLSRKRSRFEAIRTVCKLCGHNVLEGQPAVWLSNPMGLSHTECPR